MFTQEEIRIANATYRSKGSSVFDKDGNIRSVVARFVADNINKNLKILDFGCGKEFIQGKYLQSLGFDISAWDFGDNKPECCVDKLEPIYDVVYASNVLNTISSMSMLRETLNQIYGCLKEGGVFIANYPASPRKMDIKAVELKDIICDNIGKTNVIFNGLSTPIYCFVKGGDYVNESLYNLRLTIQN